MSRDTQRIEEAAAWVSRLDQPAIDTSASADFDRWMSADGHHRDDYADLQALWQSEVLTEALRDAAGIASEPAHAPVPRVRRNAGWRTPARWLAAAACAVTAIVLVPSLSTTYHAGRGNGVSIALADGSRVNLSGDAEFEVRLLPWRRDATLARGEAFFDIRHDAGRPFRVTTGGTTIRVLGTAFNVDRQSATRTVVEVYRGAVALEAGSTARMVLRRGEQARVLDDRIAPGALGRDAVARAGPGWRSGWFEAVDVPLEVLIAKVQRYSARPIRLENTALAALPISGRFRVAEPGRALRAIRSAYDLDIRYTPDAILIAPPYAATE